MSRPFVTESVYRAIAHPIRRRVIDLLAKNDMTAGDIARHFKAQFSTISEHLRVLRETGLVTQERRQRKRVYSLHAHGLGIPLDWLQPYAVRVKRSTGRSSAQP